MPLAQRNDPNIDVNMDINEPLNKIGQLGRSMKGLGNIFENFEKQVRASDDVDFKKTLKSVGDLEKEARKASGGFTLLKGTVTSFAGNVLSNAVSKLGDIAREMVNVGIETDATKTRFIALSSSVEEGVKQYDSFIALSQRFGIASEPIIKAAANFKAAGFEVEKTAEFTERLIIAAGGSSEAFEGLALAFRQINTGRVDLENLNQIAERGIPIFTVLADEMNVSVTELRDLISNSQVSIEQFNNAIRTYTAEGSLARKAAEETAETIKSQLTNLQTSFNNFSAAVVGYFEDDVSGAVQFVIGKVDELTQKIEDFQNQQRFNQILENLDIPNRNAEGLRAAFGSGIVDAGLLAPAITPADIEERIQKLEEEKQKTQEILDLQIQSGVVSEFGLQGHRNRITALEKQITPLKLALQIYKDSNKELEQGEETLENLNKEASEVVKEVSKLPENFEEIRDWADATVDLSAQLSELYGGYQEDFISAAGAAEKVTAELEAQKQAEKERNDLLRERLGLQDGEFITAEDRVKGTGRGSGGNVLPTQDERKEEAESDFNKTAEDIKSTIDYLGEVTTDIGQIFANVVNSEVQELNGRLGEVQDAQSAIASQVSEDALEQAAMNKEEYDKEIARITTEYALKNISEEKYNELREAAQEKYRKAEEKIADQKYQALRKLRKEEVDLRNKINQKTYEAQKTQSDINRGIQTALLAYETAMAVLRSFPNPFLVGAALFKGGVALTALNSVPEPKPPPTIEVPGLQTGGIVTDDIIARIGEGQDPEAILPLNPQNMEKYGFGGGKTINVYVDGSVLTDGRDLVEMLEEVMEDNRY